MAKSWLSESRLPTPSRRGVFSSRNLASVFYSCLIDCHAIQPASSFRSEWLIQTLTTFFGLCVVVVAALVVLVFGIRFRLGFGSLVVGLFVVVVVEVVVVDLRRIGCGRGGFLLLFFPRCCTVLLSKLKSLKISLYGITATYSSGFFIGTWIKVIL